MAKPKTSAGAHKPDETKGNKHKPTTKATPPSGKPHEDHGHKGTGHPKPKKPPVYPPS
jgi:hypothetical protein